MKVDSVAENMMNEGKEFKKSEETGSGRRWLFRKIDERLTKMYGETYGLSSITSSVLAGREVVVEGGAANNISASSGSINGSDEDSLPFYDINDFLNPKIKNTLSDEISLPDIDKGLERFYKAIQKKQTVGIFGDYDVDGLCATSMLLDFCRELNTKCYTWIPERDDGYGLSDRGVDFLKSKKMDLLIVLDCGSGNKAIVEALEKEDGIDVIIIDHHQIVKEMPVITAFINPFRHDASYKKVAKYQPLCATALTFLFIVAFIRKYKEKMPNIPTDDIIDYTGYAALATVCDVMSLRNVINRSLVKTGLQILSRREHVGISALVNLLNLPKDLQANHLGFCIGPRLNAGARMNDTITSFNLLNTKCPVEALKLAKKLENLNLERRNVESSFMDRAMEQAEEQKDNNALIIHGDDWNIGVIGIIASNLKEVYCKPTIVISFQEKEDGEVLGRGSARSVEGIDIGRIFHQAMDKGILISGGGHTLAAGLSMNKYKLKAFKHYVEGIIESNKFRYDPYHLIDITTTLEGFLATKDFVRIAPFGCDFTNPRICVTNVVINSIHPYKTHLLVFIAQGLVKASFIAFRTNKTKLGKMINENVGKTVSLLLSVSDSGQVHIEDISVPN